MTNTQGQLSRMTTTKNSALRTAEILIDEQSQGNEMGFGRAKTYASMFNDTNLKTQQSKVPNKMSVPLGLMNARNMRNQSRIFSGTKQAGKAHANGEYAFKTTRDVGKMSSKDSFMRMMQTKTTTDSTLKDSKQSYQAGRQSSTFKRTMIHSHTTGNLDVRSNKSQTLEGRESQMSQQSHVLSLRQSNMSSHRMLSEKGSQLSIRSSKKQEKLGQIFRSKEELMLLNMQSIYNTKSFQKARNQPQNDAPSEIESEGHDSMVQDHMEFAQTASNSMVLGLQGQSSFMNTPELFDESGVLASTLKSLNVKELQHEQQLNNKSKADVHKEAPILFVEMYQNDESQHTSSKNQPLAIEQKHFSMPDTRTPISQRPIHDEIQTRNQGCDRSTFVTEQLDQKSNKAPQFILSKEDKNKTNFLATMAKFPQNNKMTIVSPQTASEPPKRLQSGITFGKTVEMGPGVRQCGQPLSHQDNSKAMRSSLMASKSQKSILHLKRRKKRKPKKEKGWPSDQIPNLYAKPNLKYKAGNEEQKPVKESKLMKSDSDSFRSSRSPSLNTEKLKELHKFDVFKQTDKKLDKLYEMMPFGEPKASDRLKTFKKRMNVDIGRARFNAQTEIKFREWYDQKDLPDEFHILPEAEDVFEVEKAKETVVKICDHCKKNNESVAKHVKANTVYSQSVSGHGRQPSVNASTTSPCKCCTAPLMVKQSTRTAPGVLSNNWRKSNLMQHINKMHTRKVQEQQQIEMKKQHYFMSPLRSRSVEKTQESFGESFETDLITQDGFLPSNMKKNQSLDSTNSKNQKKVRIADDTNDVTIPLASKNSQRSLLKLTKHKFSRGGSCRQLMDPKQSQEMFHKQVRNFVMRDLVQIKNYPGTNLQSDPINTTQRLYKELVFVAHQKAKSQFQARDYESSIELLKSVIPLAKFALELLDLMMIYKLIAQVEYHRRQYDRALEVCHLIIYMCSLKEILANIRLEALKLAGLCRMRLQQYDEAIEQWKLCFEHALRTKDDLTEVVVYEQMSYCYFYLGDLKQAEYFNTRYRMGVLEEEDSQIRQIYAQLRKNKGKNSVQEKWNNEVQYVSDLNWMGENIFELFYYNFLEDCQAREKIIKSLKQGRTLPIFERHRCDLSKRFGIAMLDKIGKFLRRIDRGLVSWPGCRQGEIKLDEKWRNTFYLKRRHLDCDDIINLRMQIYKVCEQNLISQELPDDLQHELELIGDFIQSDQNRLYDGRENLMTQKSDLEQRENRVLKVPKLGIINVDDYTLPEMPIPNMVNIDKFKFNFKESTRNADFRAGKQYESLGLKKICPNLFVKKFKKDPVPRQMYYDEQEMQLPNVDDPKYRESLMQRALMRKTFTRDTVFMSHLSQDRCVGGKFKSEVERKKHHVRHFNELEKQWSEELNLLNRRNPLVKTAGIATKDQEEPLMHEKISNIDLKSSIVKQKNQAQEVLIKNLPIRAYFYGQDIVRDLVKIHNKMSAVRRIKRRQQEEQYTNFTDAADKEEKKPPTDGVDHGRITFMDARSPTRTAALKKGESLRNFYAVMSKKPSLGTQQVESNGPVINMNSVRFQENPSLRHCTTGLQGQMSPIASNSVYDQSSFIDTETSDQESFFRSNNDRGPSSMASSPSNSQRRFKRQAKQLGKTGANLKLQLAEVILEEENEISAVRIMEKVVDRSRASLSPVGSGNFMMLPSNQTNTYKSFVQPLSDHSKIETGLNKQTDGFNQALKHLQNTGFGDQVKLNEETQMRTHNQNSQTGKNQHQITNLNTLTEESI